MLYREVNVAVCRIIRGMAYLTVEYKTGISEIRRSEFKFIDSCFIHEFLRSNKKLQ